MGNSNADYQAKVVNASISGTKLPTILEIVRTIILSCDSELKKEEIDEFVCKKIKLPMDQSISSATSQALDKLKSENVVENVSHGYWEKC
jgi:hypothetical protein